MAVLPKSFLSVLADGLRHITRDSVGCGKFLELTEPNTREAGFLRPDPNIALVILQPTGDEFAGQSVFWCE